MAKNVYVKARMESNLKEKVEKIFSELGLNTSEAINIFFKQVERHNGLPFEMKIPNAETRKAIDDGLNDVDVTLYKTAEELFKDLEI